MINDLLQIQIEVLINTSSNQIKASGLLQSHYAPKAKVFLSTKANPWLLLVKSRLP
jgi:hypothetical protein